MREEPADEVNAAIAEIARRYPQPRSAALMVLHFLQERFGCLTPPLIEQAAEQLGLQPVNLYELVTFYPMFRMRPAGRWHLRLCRTLSCALAGSAELHRYLCEKLGLDPSERGPQTTPDGRVTVEFVDCLARCHQAPAALCNEEEWDRVDKGKLDEFLRRLESERGDELG